MFTCFVCDLLGFRARKFPAKLEKNLWIFIVDQSFYQCHIRTTLEPLEKKKHLLKENMGMEKKYQVI